MSHLPRGNSPFDAVADYLEAKERDHSPSDWPMFWPRQGIAAAQVVNRFGWVSIKPIIVIDFYRQAEPL